MWPSGQTKRGQWAKSWQPAGHEGGAHFRPRVLHSGQLGGRLQRDGNWQAEAQDCLLSASAELCLERPHFGLDKHNHSSVNIDNNNNSGEQNERPKWRPGFCWNGAKHAQRKAQKEGGECEGEDLG